MAANDTNPKADWYFTKNNTWQQETEILRSLILSCGLTETIKWGVPCYTWQEHNIVLIHTFKAYCAILFFKGALLKDPKGILVQQTKNVQAARQLRFTHTADIVKLKTTIKAYVKEAIAIEKSGAKVPLKKTAEFTMPQEFKDRLADDKLLHKAFKALTPGRQRAYLLYFSSAKQAATRLSRIEKNIERIMHGKGLDDDYI